MMMAHIKVRGSSKLLQLEYVYHIQWRVMQ